MLKYCFVHLKILVALGFDVINISENDIQGGSLRLLLQKTGLGIVKKEPKIIVETFVSSSDPSILYTTKKIEREDGSFVYSCTCPGAWRAKDKRCKHIKILEKRV